MIENGKKDQIEKALLSKYEKVTWSKRYSELEEAKASCDFILTCLSETLPSLPEMAKKIKPIVEFCYENNIVKDAIETKKTLKTFIDNRIEKTGYQ